MGLELINSYIESCSNIIINIIIMSIHISLVKHYWILGEAAPKLRRLPCNLYVTYTLFHLTSIYNIVVVLVVSHGKPVFAIETRREGTTPG